MKILILSYKISIFSFSHFGVKILRDIQYTKSYLSLYKRQILSLSTFNFLATNFLSSSTESFRETWTLKGPPVKGATRTSILSVAASIEVDTFGLVSAISCRKILTFTQKIITKRSRSHKRCCLLVSQLGHIYNTFWISRSFIWQSEDNNLIAIKIHKIIFIKWENFLKKNKNQLLREDRLWIGILLIKRAKTKV